jgi:hypothetical protein
MGKKSQISLEFISIFAIGLAITLLVGSLFFYLSSSEKKSLDIKQINKIGSDLISNSEEIYFRGSGNKIQYKAQFPTGIESLEIKQINTTLNNFSELHFGLNIDDTFETVIFSSTQDYITLNCSTTCNYNSTTKVGTFNSSDFSNGPKTLSIRSIGDQVLIDFVR